MVSKTLPRTITILKKEPDSGLANFQFFQLSDQGLLSFCWFPFSDVCFRVAGRLGLLSPNSFLMHSLKNSKILRHKVFPFVKFFLGGEVLANSLLCLLLTSRLKKFSEERK